MINITKYTNNEFVLYLKDAITLPNPYFIFEFVDTYNDKLTLSLTDKSTNTNFNLFDFYESSTGILSANGELNVYESVVDVSTVTGLNKIYNGLYRLIQPANSQVTFDPSIQYTDSVFDPCSGYNIINEDIVFDPIWVSGNTGPLGIPATQILQDPSHRFVTDTDISTWNTENPTYDSITLTPQTFVNSLGKLQYDVDEGTLSFGIVNGSLQMNKETFDYYTNLSGTTLVDGDVVSVIGVSGNRQAVGLTNAKNAISALACIGMVTDGGAPNAKVRVTKIGDVHQLPTAGLIEGMPVYVDPNNPGKLTQSVPLAPNFFIQVGIVIVANANVGVIGIDIRVSPRLEDLSDVDGTPLTATGQFPVWHSDTSVFDFDYNINNYSIKSTTDASISEIKLKNINQDTSINFLYTQLGGSGVTQAYVDGSLATRDIQITNNTNTNISQDASITRIEGLALAYAIAL